MEGSWLLAWSLCLVLVEYSCLIKSEDRVAQAVKGVKDAVGGGVGGAASGAAAKWEQV